MTEELVFAVVGVVAIVGIAMAAVIDASVRDEDRKDRELLTVAIKEFRRGAKG
jgi:hypothetical protein